MEGELPSPRLVPWSKARGFREFSCAATGRVARASATEIRQASNSKFCREMRSNDALRVLVSAPGHTCLTQAMLRTLKASRNLFSTRWMARVSARRFTAGKAGI